MKIGRLLLHPVTALALLLVTGGTHIQPSHAMNYIQVNTVSDDLSDNGNCSLREAVQAANTDLAVDGCPAGSGSDTILLKAATYPISQSEPGNEDDNQTGDFDILGSLTILGMGEEKTIIDGQEIGRVLDFRDPTAAYAIRDLTVQGGLLRGNREPGGSGAGIQNLGTLQMQNVRVTGGQIDQITQRRGAGIFNAGTLLIKDCQIDQNSGDFSGGGIASTGSLTVENSTFLSNYGMQAADLDLYGEGSHAVMRGMYFQDSYCSPVGAAVAVGEGASLSMENSRFRYINCENAVIESSGKLSLIKQFFDFGGDQNGSVHLLAGELLVRDSDFGHGDFLKGSITISGGQAVIENTIIAESNGSGLFVEGGYVLLTGSHISQMTIPHASAGLQVEGGQALVVNSTISSNQSSGPAGVQVKGGELELESVTIANNQGGQPALTVQAGSVIIHNTLIATNTGLSGEFLDCLLAPNTTLSLGYNLVGVVNGCGWRTATGDHLGTRFDPVDARLGDLMQQDSYTKVHPLLAGSPAIDSADPDHFPSEDQRGTARPQGQRADIGAFEADQDSIEILFTIHLPLIQK